MIPATLAQTFTINNSPIISDCYESYQSAFEESYFKHSTTNQIQSLVHGMIELAKSRFLDPFLKNGFTLRALSVLPFGPGPHAKTILRMMQAAADQNSRLYACVNEANTQTFQQTTVTIVKDHSLEALNTFWEKNQGKVEKPAVLVFACSEYREGWKSSIPGVQTLSGWFFGNWGGNRPGGDAHSPRRSAQEETIARCTTFLPTLDRHMDTYRKGSGSLLLPWRYLPKMGVAIAESIRLIQENARHLTFLQDKTFTLISGAAPNLNLRMSDRQNYLDSKKGERISATSVGQELEGVLTQAILGAKQAGSNTIVLGKLGMGVFKNPPEIVAHATARAIQQAGGIENIVLPLRIPTNPHELDLHTRYVRKLDELLL